MKENDNFVCIVCLCVCTEVSQQIVGRLIIVTFSWICLSISLNWWREILAPQKFLAHIEKSLTDYSGYIEQTTFFSNKFRPKYKKLRMKPAATHVQICNEFCFTSSFSFNNLNIWPWIVYVNYQNLGQFQG